MQAYPAPSRFRLLCCLNVQVAEVVQEHLDSIYEMNGHVQGEQDGDGYSDGDASSRPASRRFSETSGGSLLPSESGTSLGNDVQVWRRSIDGTSSDEEDIQVVPFASDIGQLSDGASPLQDKSIVTPWGGGNIRADGWAEPPPLPGMMPDNDEANQDVVLPFFEPSERISLTRHDPASDMTSPLMPDDPTRPSAPAVGRRAPGSFTAAGPVAEELLPRLSNASAFTRESDGPENEDRKSIFTMEKRRFLGGKARKNFFSRLRRSLSLGHMSPRQERAAQLQKEIREARMLLGEELPEGSEETVSTRGKNNFPPLDGLSLWCIPATNPVRIFMYKLCTTKAFDHVMFFFIILSCAAMVYEHPFIEIDSLEHWVLYWLEVMLTIIFGLEAVIKIVSFGFTPYIRSVTNVIDLMIVVVGVLLLALDSVADDIPGIQGLGVLRAAKPLRALTRSQGMMLVFKSLSMSMMSMADVSIICLLFFFIFGIMGTQLFGGTFYYCTQPRNIDGALIDTREDCNGLGEDGEPLEWINGFPNFDHLGNSLLTLFMTSTLDGYAESMQLAMSIRGTDLQPRLGANTAAFIFFCLFIMVVAFCLLNLYVGVVFYQFSRIRMLSSAGAAFLTTGQHEWMEMSKLVFRLQPLDKVIVPKRRFRRLCHKICTNWAFEKMITATILVNVVFMALEHYNMSERLTGKHLSARLLYFQPSVFSLRFELQSKVRVKVADVQCLP